MKRVRLIRQQRELTLRRLSVLAGIDPGTLSRIETGRLRPYGKDLARICGALNWPCDRAAELLEDVSDDA